MRIVTIDSHAKKTARMKDTDRAPCRPVQSGLSRSFDEDANITEEGNVQKQANTQQPDNSFEEDPTVTKAGCGKAGSKNEQEDRKNREGGEHETDKQPRPNHEVASVISNRKCATKGMARQAWTSPRVRHRAWRP